MVIYIKFEVHRVISIMIRTTTHKTDTALHLEITLLMTNVPLLYTILVHDMTIIKDLLDRIVLLTDPRIDPLKDMTPVKEDSLVLELLVLELLVL